MEKRSPKLEQVKSLDIDMLHHVSISNVWYLPVMGHHPNIEWFDVKDQIWKLNIQGLSTLHFNKLQFNIQMSSKSHIRLNEPSSHWTALFWIITWAFLDHCDQLLRLKDFSQNASVSQPLFWVSPKVGQGTPKWETKQRSSRNKPQDTTGSMENLGWNLRCVCWENWEFGAHYRCLPTQSAPQTKH